MTVSSNLVTTNRMITNLVEMRQSMEKLNVQLSSGKRADTYGGLGRDRTFDVAFRSRLAKNETFQNTAKFIDLRLSTMNKLLEGMGKLQQDSKAAINPNKFTLGASGKTGSQTTTSLHMREMISQLNTEIAGRHVFSGRTVDTRPVADYDVIMNGDGNKDGFGTVLNERKQADLGTGTGRTVSSLSTTTTTFSEDAAPSPFGFKLSGMTSTLSNATTNGPSGSPSSLTVDFTGIPAAGESVKVQLTLPDSSTVTLTLEAGSSNGDGKFAIGADATATAANFKAALDAEVQELAKTELMAASALAAGEDFFATASGAEPQRVSGTPLSSATSLTDGSATTINWYQGDNTSDDPRTSVQARVDTAITVSYGARANEDGIRKVIQNLAVFTAESFSDSNATEKNRYSALADRLRDELSTPSGTQSIQTIHREMAGAHVATKNAVERHKIEKGSLQLMIDKIENISNEEVASQMLALQTRMQATYQTTAKLFQMNLSNYI